MAMPRKRKIYAVPVLGYVLHFIEAFFRLPRNDLRVSELRTQTKMLHDRISDIDRHLPELLNAANTVAALGTKFRLTEDRLDQIAGNSDQAGMFAGIRQTNFSQGERIRELWERIELVQRGIFIELARRAEGGGVFDIPRPARILAPKKLAAAKEQGMLRLNLGCGHMALASYINVDIRELPKVDVVAAADDLPIEPGMVDEVFSSHLMDRFPQEALRRRLLPYWYELLRPGGVLRAVMPDAAAMIAAAADGSYNFEDFRDLLFGAQDYDGDYRYNMLSPDSMANLLEEAGFTEVNVPVARRQNGKCYEFEISARKPDEFSSDA